jgi:anti-sigma regulatory factor (Ser/Thr protein kinase)
MSESKTKHCHRAAEQTEPRSTTPSSINAITGHGGAAGQMASRSGGVDDDRGCRRKDTYDRPGSMLLDVRLQGGILVIRPVGHLTPKTYEQLRDGLFKFAAEEPAAIVVNLACMQTTVASLLNVFPTVHDRINNWPGVPLILAAACQSLRTMLGVGAIPRSVPTYRTLTEALKAVDAAPCRYRRQIQLPANPASARLARRLVEQTCQEWGIPQMAADAVIVVSELTDNMVTHGRSEGWLRLDLRNNRLTIAVADADPRPPALRIPGLPVVGGRGLLLVDKLSRTWGTESRPGGKVVWAVLTVA